MQIPGVEISINYNAGNLRVTTVEWAIPLSGIVLRARIWNNDALIYDRTQGGPANGVENVPGNLRVQQYTEDGITFYDLPPNITYSINLETIG